MNKNILIGLALLATGSLLGLFLVPRLLENLPAGTAQPRFGDLISVGTETGLHRAFVRSTSGLVEIAPPPGDADFRPLGPGVFLDRRVYIRSASDSTAVLQFGNAATVKVEPDTLVEVLTEAYKGGEVLVTLRVQDGEVLARAVELAAHERLRIVSSHAVTTVEAGSLMVRTVSDEAGAPRTRVAVMEGAAVVLPGTVDPQRLALISGARALQRASETVHQASGRVGAGQELSLGAEDVPGGVRVLDEVQRRIEQAAGAGERISRAELQRISTVMEFAAESIAQGYPDSTPVSEHLETRLRALAQPSAQALSAAMGSGVTPATVRIETDPADAEIYLEDLPIGKRIYSALFLEDERPVFEVRRQGYYSQRIQIEFDEQRDQVLRVSLQPMEPALSVQEFMEAAAAGRADEIAAYLGSGGEVNALDQDGLNALARALGMPRFARGDLSAFRPDIRTLTLLLEAGIDLRLPFYVDGRRFFALHIPVLAALAGVETNLELVAMLIESGARVDGYLETGEMSVTPLGAAVIVGLEAGKLEYELIELLLAHGADPNAGLVYEGRVMDVLSAAVVMSASTGSDAVGLVQLLLKYGARQNLRFRLNGRIGSPLQFAEQLGLDELAVLLRSELAAQ